MLQKQHIFCVLSLIAVLGLGVFVPKAYAAMSLDAIPLDGGASLRFTRGDLSTGITRQVRVRINSSDNVQYQVFQQIVSPFSNERGSSINRPVLEASILQGSNTAGTIYLPSFEPVNFGEQLLFTSSANGQSDSFTVVYHVNTALLSDAGSFNGQLLYVLRPINGGQRQSVQTNVFIESNAELNVDVDGSSGHNLVRLDTNRENSSAYVKVSFSGNLGSTIKVYQELVRTPVDDLNSELNSGILTVVNTGGQQGDLSFQSPAEIPHNRALIYKSNQQSDSFEAKFSFDSDKLSLQKAGSFRGLLHYTVETDSAQKEFDIDLDITVAPVFEITMTFPQGPVNFTNILPGEKPVLKEVDVKINSNLGRAYTVIQHMPDLLTNDKGDSVPGEYFLYKIEPAEGSKAKFPAKDFISVAKGDKVIFYSDAKGSPEEFKVFYKLSPFDGMQAGDYSSTIKYSLGEL